MKAIHLNSQIDKASFLCTFTFLVTDSFPGCQNKRNHGAHPSWALMKSYECLEQNNKHSGTDPDYMSNCKESF